MDEDDQIHQTKEWICNAVVHYFQKAYDKNDNILAEDLIWGIEPYPTMYEDEQNDDFYKEVTNKKLLNVLKSFKSDKSLGPDGWTIELFTHFFEILKKDLLSMVEESRSMGYIHRHITSTYITLIPNKINEKGFLKFRAISLWNIIYQIISKTIAGRMPNTLSWYISLEKHGFLDNRVFHDVVANTAVSMHMIHTKNINAGIFQIDLRKA